MIDIVLIEFPQVAVAYNANGEEVARAINLDALRDWAFDYREDYSVQDVIYAFFPMLLDFDN